LKRLTQNQVLENFRKVHGDKYDYSLVNYTKTSQKVKIICIRHGAFDQRPNDHLQGNGCPICVGKIKHDAKSIISKFQSIHGDRYDYSKVEYINYDVNVKIVCKEHGEFNQTPSNHIAGKGCPDCGGRPNYNKKKIITSFQKIHGKRYDYSLVNFKDVKHKVKIICRQHGDFEQSPDSHLRGSGCPKCPRKPRNSTETIVEEFKMVHGKQYDYSLVDYKRSDIKVKIICDVHGVFEQTPESHLAGSGCRDCSGVPRYDQQKIIKKFREIHGDRYDYSLIQFVTTKEKIKIICQIHGVFEQTPQSHFKGANCPKCVGNTIKNNSKIIDEFKKIHGNRYDYSLVDYQNSKTPVKIICREHGVFEQSPVGHRKGKGCSDCAGRPKYDSQKIISKFLEVHGGKYDYSEVVYVNAHKHVKIICKIHGPFEQAPTHHLQGQGCPTCNFGWTKEKIVQYINSIENHDLLHMDGVELQMIINQGKLPDAFHALVFSDDPSRDNTLRTLKEKLQKEIEQHTEACQIIDNEVVMKGESIIIDDEEPLINASPTASKENGLMSLSENINDLHVLDDEIVTSCDGEVIEFLIQYKLRKLWNKVLNNMVIAEEIIREKGGKNFNHLKQLFLNEYNQVITYKPPKGYEFPHQLNSMQKLIVYRMLKNRRYGNWSGTGAGKTVSFIVASREVNSRLTIVVAVNSIINELNEAIIEVFPDSKIYTVFKKGQIFDRNQYNYLLLNYEKFQQGYSEELFQNLTDQNRIDFITIDEVHNVKQRSNEESARRGVLKRLIGRASENNPDLYVFGMSATPVVNNLTEAKSLLELVTGKDFKDLNTIKSVNNAIEVFKHMTINGLRYLPKYQISIKELDGSNTSTLRINGVHLLKKLFEVNNKSYLDLERLLLFDKLKSIEPYLKKGVIIYTYFTFKMVKPIVEHVKKLGYRVGTYTGEESSDEREVTKSAFKDGKLDLIVGSRPIGTGVNGLQKVCNRLIILSLPWTDTEYTQLKGRIYRQGSNFGEVEIIIPQVVLASPHGEWSWDLQRMNLIQNKKTLADACIDGIIPSKRLPSPETLYNKSLEALKEWRDRVTNGKIIRIERKNLVFPLRPELLDQIGRSLGDFSEVNRVWSIRKSSTTHNRLQQHPEDWYYYHALYSEKRKTWEEIPFVEIAKLIKRKEFVIADLGCGENLLRRELPDNRILAFDHIAIDDSVIACDICKLPIESDSVDVTVFSLSLMGTNFEEYILEAHRVLKPMGFLFIAEPQTKWEGKQEELELLVLRLGFGKPVIWKSGSFIYLKSEKG
jgi:superfamily II DNA or RNA helicase